MRLRLSESEKQRVRKNYKKLYGAGLRNSPEPQRWEFVAIEIGLLLSAVWRSLRRFFGYHNIDLY
jgi:hypothetical protein